MAGQASLQGVVEDIKRHIDTKLDDMVTKLAKRPKITQQKKNGPIRQSSQPDTVTEDERSSLEIYLSSDKLLYSNEHQMEAEDLWREYKRFCKEHGLQFQDRKQYGEDMLQTALGDIAKGAVLACPDRTEMIVGVDFSAKIRQRQELAVQREKAGVVNSLKAFLLSEEVSFHPSAQIDRKNLLDEYKAFCRRQKLRMETWASALVIDAFGYVEAKHPEAKIVPHDWMGIA